jgi:cobalt/nickel transport system permease protein
MGAGSFSLALPWAVHISDGVLTPAWLVGGFVVASLLALLAAYRVRDEEIPRIAILSAAFFVATLLHLPLGPTRVHLLFNGLVGVVLGRRAPLAILIGIALQSVFGHGGFTTIGINACVMTFPALLAGWMFAGLHYLPWVRQKRSSLLWICGCLIGMTSVLATLILNAVVLLWGGAEDWHQIVWLVFYAHVPLVALEGVVLGFTVSFLARVKPEMLGLPIRYPLSAIRHPPSVRADSGQRTVDSGLLLAALTMLCAVSPAHAHRLDASFSVGADHQIKIESWFNPGGAAKGAKVQVFRPGPRLLAEGQLDENGQFVFSFVEAEPLEVIVSDGAGHRKSFVISQEKLEPSAKLPDPSDPSSGSGPLQRMDPDAARRERFKDALLGISFLLALGAFLLSWRNARKLKSLQSTERTNRPNDSG